jgi:hypothetical protein
MAASSGPFGGDCQYGPSGFDVTNFFSGNVKEAHARDRF